MGFKKGTREDRHWLMIFAFASIDYRFYLIEILFDK